MLIENFKHKAINEPSFLNGGFSMYKIRFLSFNKGVLSTHSMLLLLRANLFRNMSIKMILRVFIY
jgi:hypothetical protein